MTRSVYSIASPERRAHSVTKPVVRASTHSNARTVWALCAVALSGAALVAWIGQEPDREAVVLSPQAQASALAVSQGASAPSMAQFPALATPHALPPAAPPVAATTTFPPPPVVEVREARGVRSESLSVTAGVSGVPVSTWPVATRAPNDVPPRSDMRYLGGAPSRR